MNDSSLGVQEVSNRQGKLSLGFLDLSRLPTALGVALIAICLQFLWLQHFLDPKVAQLHLIPGSITMGLVVAFASFAWRTVGRQYLFLLSYTILTLRLPIALAPELKWFSWLVFFLLCGATLAWCYRYFSEKKSGRYFALAGALVLFNALNHLSLESPFTHTFRLIIGEVSDFQGVDNNTTWQCAYDGTEFAVTCDARHFIASELIFTDAQYDPSFSVVLSRFYSGYLNSLLGTDSLRWYASLCIHILVWFLTCLAIFRICCLTGLSLRAAQISMLSAASAWGFVSMVAQPAPYLLSYAFAVFSLWAVAEWVLARDNPYSKRLVLLAVSILSVAVYESYPISLVCVLLLCFYRHYSAAGLIFVGQLMLVLIWKKVGLEMIVGTAGDIDNRSSGVSNIAHDINEWFQIITSLDVARFFRYVFIGILAYGFGNLIVGALGGIAVLIKYWRLATSAKPTQFFWLMLLLVNVMMLAAAVFIVPQTHQWSPTTGMQPRIAFFSFAINLIALTYLVERLSPRFLIGLPVLFLLIANVDKTGFAGIAMMFDYGSLSWSYRY